ncbi:MAG: polysulfide reductase NrfD [Actinobacteria bacterium]|nr:polysulfide reductase NrfD [Actinomycetota bacterium]
MTSPNEDRNSYYGKPVVAEPVWEPTVAAYFFSGGLAGAAAGLGLLARLRGMDRLARSCTLLAFGGAAVSPAFLIEDLGRPDRFHHMLRTFKVTSPMSVGTWLLSGFGSLSGLAAASELTGIGRRWGRLAEAGAATLGLPLSTYTAALVANTSIPAWREARRTLPFLFAAGSAASAGAAAAALTPAGEAAMASRLAIGGAAAEVVLGQVMERTLGEAGHAYHQGPALVLSRLAAGLALAGAGAMAASGPASRRPWARPMATAGAAAVLAGTLLERLAVWRAGSQSARVTLR